MIKIKLHNTLTRKKQIFVPLDENNVRLYLCGPTVYDRAHLGNARNVIMFDVLYRLLIQVYGKKSITYVRNFTDIDDKINNKSLESGRPITDITSETIQWYLDDMAALGNLEPNLMPKATDYIPQMINFIERLITKGFAYVEEGHVLFSVSKYKNYGKLSNKKLEELVAGSRVEVSKLKKDPLDFILWKPALSDEPGWDSPWGRGRPGWHLECSVMSGKYLGKTFDIHGGGLDLLFPHHENEIAQSCANNSTEILANYWVHNGFLNMKKEKMSKSLGNIQTISEALEDYSGQVIRLALLSAHYKQPLDWNENILEQNKVNLEKWYEVYDEKEKDTDISDIFSLLLDDLNTPKYFAKLHELYSSAAKGDQKSRDQFNSACRLIGIFNEKKDSLLKQKKNKSSVDEKYILGKINERLQARKDGNYKLADQIRDDLLKKGIVIEDKQNKTEWKYK